MFYELPNMGFLKIQGIDAKKMLQGQLTCNVDLVTSLQSCMGAHCNPQGRIISLFYLFIYQDAYYLMMPRNMVLLALSALKKYAVFFKTALSDASDTMSAIGLVDVIQDISEEHAVIQTEQHSSRRIIVATENTMPRIQEKLGQPANTANQTSWRCQDMLAGIPCIYPETSGKFLPHEIGLDKLGAISFDKGCYTGQEIIARMHYRGKLKNHLYKAVITSDIPPVPGAAIYTEARTDLQPCGVVVDFCHQEYNHYLVLIVTDEESAANKTLYLDANKNVVISLSETHAE